jgi:hypothetical protein
MTRTPIALEVGAKRTFASALEWPGWCRAGRDEDTAVRALTDAGPRYATVLKGVVRGFAPSDPEVVERLPGGATTDFGAPGAVAAADERPVDARELARLEAILRACWAAFDRAAAVAEGVPLATGPRGGGRSLEKICRHVGDAEGAYLRSLGGAPRTDVDTVAARQAFLDGLAARARGEVPDVGPRGGRRWPARYAARRAAWHVLDHAWEIEDRAGA